MKCANISLILCLFLKDTEMEVGAEDANEEEDADEQVEIAETYQDYKPAKCENWCIYN